MPIYSKHSKPTHQKPDITVNFTHLNKTRCFFDVDFNQGWNEFIQNNVKEYLSNYVQNCDYFINDWSNHIVHDCNCPLSFICNSGDEITIELKPNTPSVPKSIDYEHHNHDMTDIHICNFHNDDEKNYDDIHNNKHKISKKIADLLCNVHCTNKKLLKLTEIHSHDNNYINLNDDAKDDEKKTPRT